MNIRGLRNSVLSLQLFRKSKIPPKESFIINNKNKTKVYELGAQTEPSLKAATTSPLDVTLLRGARWSGLGGAGRAPGRRGAGCARPGGAGAPPRSHPGAGLCPGRDLRGGAQSAGGRATIARLSRRWPQARQSRGGAGPGPCARRVPSKVGSPGDRALTPAARAWAPPAPGEWVSRCPRSCSPSAARRTGAFPCKQVLGEEAILPSVLGSDSLGKKFLRLREEKELPSPVIE